MKRQTSLRLSDATFAKLDELAGRYGTKTEAIAVAVDRLHTAEEAAMNEHKYLGYVADDLSAPNHVCYKADAVVCSQHANCRWHIDRDDNEIHVRQENASECDE